MEFRLQKNASWCTRGCPNIDPRRIFWRRKKLFTYSYMQATRPLFKRMKIRYMFEYILFVRKNQVFSKENRVEILKNFTQNLKLRGKDQRKKYICDYIMRKWLSHNKR